MLLLARLFRARPIDARGALALRDSVGHGKSAGCWSDDRKLRNHARISVLARNKRLSPDVRILRVFVVPHRD